VANTHAAVPEMQALPVFRFMEAGSTARSTAWNVGQKPPLRSHLCKGHFDAPIGLGVPSSLIGPQDKARHAQIITKAVIFFLRHGLLYYHYSSVNAGANPEGTFATDVVPKQGPGAGGYGPVNHMFPMTPVELHAGWIVGRERTVACVSGAYRWAPARRPNVLVFDIRGRRVKDPLVEVNREGDGWRVALTLEDWAEIAVIE
jgi:hypothetical protein